MSHPDDEILSAFLDDELPLSEAERLRARLAEDAEMRERLRRLEAVDALLRRAFQVPLRRPLPERLLRGLQGEPEGATVAPLPRRGAAASPRGRLAWPLAAAIALAVGLGAGLGLGGLVPAPSSGWYGEAALGLALERAPSGAPVVAQASGLEVEVTPLLTFRGAGGRACREFEARAAARRDAQGIACRGERGGWRAEVVAFAAPPRRLDAVREAMAEQPPLTPEEESELLGRGWR